MVPQAFSPHTWEEEASGACYFRTACSVKGVPGQPGLYSSQETETSHQKPTCWDTPVTHVGGQPGIISTNSRPACVNILRSREGKERMKGRKEKGERKEIIKDHQYSTKLLPSGSNMQFTFLNYFLFQSKHYN